MMKYIWLVVALLAFHFGGGYFATSERRVEKYIHNFSMLSNQDAAKACELVDDKVDVSLTQELPTSTWEVEGGKDELCGFMKQGIAAMTVLQGNITWRFENMQVKSSFPWQSVKVSYDEIATISAAQMGTIHTKMHYDLQLKRKLTGGLVVTKVHASGGVE